MRERKFRVPSVQDILLINGFEAPKKIDYSYIISMLDKGDFIIAGNTYAEAVDVAERLSGKKKIIIFPSNFSLNKEQIHHGIKSLDWLVKIDSQHVLRNLAPRKQIPRSLTKWFLEENSIRPEYLVASAIKLADSENPPIGFYWIGWDGIPRATSWIQSAAASEINMMQKAGDFPAGNVVDKIPYGRNMRVRVASRSEQGKSYDFSLLRLPIFRSRTDVHRYSYWVNIAHTSSDPWSNYLAEHEKQALPLCFWSTPAILGTFISMNYLERTNNPLQFRVNPFPIPANKQAVSFIDDLRLKSLIFRKDERGEVWLSSLRKTEMDKLIGSRTIIREYNNCWSHWGKCDRTYLYNPQ